MIQPLPLAFAALTNSLMFVMPESLLTHSKKVSSAIRPIGVNVIQQAITGFCPAAMGLRKLGMKTEREIGAQQCG